jgi:acetoin utilization deacetylase AcuC-like enzyme
MTTSIYSHPACLAHRPGPHHPESPQRLEAVLQALDATEFAGVRRCDAPRGTREQVLLAHSAGYVDAVEAAAPHEGYRALDGGDTIMSPGTWEAVLRCVGAVCAAVDDVASGQSRNAFCATRPCGHHAEAERAMGSEAGVAGNIVNIPLQQGCDSATFRRHMRTRMLPALRDFAPQLLVISAGFDAHHLDPLGGLSLTDDDFHWITRELMAVADDCARGRVVSTLEGGYSPQGLASGTAAHVRALMQA